MPSLRRWMRRMGHHELCVGSPSPRTGNCRSFDCLGGLSDDTGNWVWVGRPLIAMIEGDEWGTGTESAGSSTVESSGTHSSRYDCDEWGTGTESVGSEWRAGDPLIAIRLDEWRHGDWASARFWSSGELVDPLIALYGTAMNAGHGDDGTVGVSECGHGWDQDGSWPGAWAEVHSRIFLRFRRAPRRPDDKLWGGVELKLLHG